MKKPSKQRARKELLREFRMLGGTNRYVDSAEMVDGTLVLVYDHISSPAHGVDKTLTSRYVTTVGPGNRSRGSIIVSSWWQ